ncbi:sunset domain-containing protein [Tessaracoccus caeni]|uniref:sunset domain-containing protein n=1 Tax=Tessaracoccus caeni TaxID=3031239 RepID=UPI0023DBAD49|nr:hypothetical protein [Tessaracoccus caeni]MDF1488878.1 hypothetical protein [Tessaracoccus caeni]
MGLVAQPAAAADSERVSGSGTGESDYFWLDEGIYTIDFEYSDNVDGLVAAWLISEQIGDYDITALSVEAADTTRTVVWVFEGDYFWFDVDAESGAAWSAEVAPATLPAKAERSFSASNRGLNSSQIVLLEAGKYDFTASYSGNAVIDLAFDAELLLVDPSNDDYHELLFEEESTSGKRTGTFELEKAGYVWVGAFGAPGMTWTVDAALHAPKKLTTTPTPKISGTAQVGKKLTATPGTWAPSGVKLSYQWLRDGKAIKGATKSTYTLTSSDKGKKISVQVKGSKSGYTSVTKTSSKTSAVKAGTLSSATPKISGTAQVGKKLTAKPGTWKPSGVTFSYQWLRNGAKIKGATKSTYTLTNSDKGKKISVKVTGKKSGYTSVTKTSAKTSSVKAKAASKPASKPSSTAPTSRGTCPSSAPIKGNASSMIYHMKGQRFYDRTNPEECFSSESAAKKAGYRKAKV